MIFLNDYGWWIKFAPAFYMLSGMNAIWLFFMSTVFAQGIIAPLTVTTSVTADLDLGDNSWSYLTLSLKDIPHPITGSDLVCSS